MEILSQIYSKLRLLTALIVVLFLATCEKEHAKRDFPRTLTSEVTDISATDVVFHGEILSLGREAVTDHGFIYSSTPSSAVLKHGTVLSLGPVNQPESFSCKAAMERPKPMRYYVRTYLTTETYTVYGNTVSFDYPGGLAPLIDSVTPLTATWRDTLTITGEMFDEAGKYNTVMFDSLKASLVFQSDTLLKVIVPDQLKKTHASIIVKVFSKTVTFSEEFSLLQPELTGFDPDSAFYRDLITLHGKYFHPDKDQNTVQLDNTACRILSFSTEEISFRLPEGLSEGWHTLKLTTQAFTLSPAQEMYCSTPVPDKIFPLTGIFLDTLTLTGKNLHPEKSTKRVLMGKASAQIVYASDTLIRFVVPMQLNQNNAEMTYSVDGYHFPVENQVFGLLPPGIVSVSPDTCDINGKITIHINGKNFRGTYSSITIQNRGAAVLSGSGLSDLFTRIPYNINVPDGKVSLAVSSVPGLSVTWEQKLNIYPPRLLGFSADSFIIGETASVNTRYLNDHNPLYYNDFYIGDHPADFFYTSYSGILSFFVPENTPMETEVHAVTNGQQGNSLTLRLKKIAITNVLPKTIHRNSSVAVIGRNFCHTSQGNRYNKIYLSIMDEQVPLTYFSSNKLAFKIPNRFFESGPVTLTLHVGVQTITLTDYLNFVESWEEWDQLDIEKPVELTTALIGEDVYVGPSSNEKDFWKYNIPGKTLTRLPDLPAECAGPSSFALGGKIYLFGFNPDSTNYSSTEGAFSYDPASGEWSDLTLPDDISVHPFMTAFTIAGKAYIGLGSLGFDSYSDWYEFDGTSGTWSRKASFPGTLPASFSPVSFVIGETGYVITRAGELWQYDPATDQWSQKANTPFSSRTKMVAFSLDGKGYAGLGQDNSFTTYYDFWEYDPATDSWTKMLDSPVPLSYAFSFAYDGKGYIGGGLTDPGTPNKTLYRFTPY